MSNESVKMDSIPLNVHLVREFCMLSFIHTSLQLIGTLFVGVLVRFRENTENWEPIAD